MNAESHNTYKTSVCQAQRLPVTDFRRKFVKDSDTHTKQEKTGGQVLFLALLNQNWQNVYIARLLRIEHEGYVVKG